MIKTRNALPHVIKLFPDHQESVIPECFYPSISLGIGEVLEPSGIQTEVRPDPLMALTRHT